MKNRSLLLFAISHIVICLGVFPSASAQQNYDLKQYVIPDYQLRALNLNFSSGAISRSFKSELDQVNRNYNFRRFDADIHADYYAVKNSRSFQGSQSIYFSVAPAFFKQKENISGGLSQQESFNKQRQTISNFGYSTSNRYYNAKKQFFEIGASVDGRYSASNFKVTSISGVDFVGIDRSNGRAVDLFLPVGLGTGRIEPVQDARMATYILDDLYAAGNLTKQPGQQEMLKLAEAITKVKNRRFFHPRLKKIAEITAIDSAIRQMGINSETGASYYTAINDNWEFAYMPGRQSGRRLSFQILPAISFTALKSNTRTESVSQTLPLYIMDVERYQQHLQYQLGAGFDYRMENPVSLAWQHSTRAGVSYVYQAWNRKQIIKDLNTSPIETKTDSYMPFINAHLMHAIGYYPNSRTSFSLMGSLFYEQRLKIVQTDDFNLAPAYYGIYPAVGFAGDYYFSARLQLSFTAGSEYVFQDVRAKASNGIKKQLIERFENYFNIAFVYRLL